MTKEAQDGVRREIVEAAVECILQSNVDSVQITQIAARANISTRTLHRYYPEKATLLVEAVAEYLSQMYMAFAQMYESADKSGMNGLQRLMLVLQTQYDYCQAHPAFAARFIDLRMYRIRYGHRRGSWSLEGGEKIRDIVVSNLIDGQLDGSVRPELDVFRTAALISSSFHGVMQRMAFTRRAQVAEARRAEMTHVFDDCMEMLRNYLSQ